MAWSDPIYTRHADEAEARAQAAALGVVFPTSGAVPAGNQNYALDADIGVPFVTPPVEENGEVVTPGVVDPEGGYWSMLAVNLEWEGAAATLAAIEGAGVRRYPAHPPRVWA